MNPVNPLVYLLSEPDVWFPVLFTMACAFHDLRTGKVPNAFILCGILCGLASALMSGPVHPAGVRILKAAVPPEAAVPGPSGIRPAGFGSRMLGFLLPYLLLGLLVPLRMIGGGDVKLLSVIGLFFGHRTAAYEILYAFFIGAGFSAAVLIRRKNAHRRFRYLISYLRSLTEARIQKNASCPLPPLPGYRGDKTSDGEFCFSVPIFLALCLILSLAASPSCVSLSG